MRDISRVRQLGTPHIRSSSLYPTATAVPPLNRVPPPIHTFSIAIFHYNYNHSFLPTQFLCLLVALIFSHLVFLPPQRINFVVLLLVKAAFVAQVAEKMAAKLEVQVRHCFCCGLTPGAFLIGLYSLLFYALLTILASMALSDLSMNGDNTYNYCEQEVQGKNDQRVQVHPTNRSKVVFEDTSSYHCSFGMYTEEMKFAKEGRSLALLIALCLYVPLILASLAVMAGVAFRSAWLLLPWLILMPFDIIRGLISSILILIMSQGMLARIATGIFFLAFQFLHISLWILVLAKFQRLRHRRLGPHPQYDIRQPFPPQPHQTYGYYGGGPTNYAYSPQSGRRVPVVPDEYPPPPPPPMNGQRHAGGHHQMPSSYSGGYDGARY